MKRKKFILFIILFLAGSIGLYLLISGPTDSNNSTQKIEEQPQKAEKNYPLMGPEERITKKPFGVFVTPQNSPVNPERFRGYHTGTDFEVFENELNKVLLYGRFAKAPCFKKEWSAGMEAFWFSPVILIIKKQLSSMVI